MKPMNRRRKAPRDPEWTAPEGAVWACGACGKNGKQRDEIGDESCFMNALLCKDDKPPDVKAIHHHWSVFSSQGKE